MIKFKLKVLCAANDITQSQFAEKYGIRPSTLSALNKGTMISVPNIVLESACKEFNCEVGDVIQYIPDKPEEK